MWGSCRECALLVQACLESPLRLSIPAYCTGIRKHLDKTTNHSLQGSVQLGW